MPNTSRVKKARNLRSNGMTLTKLVAIENAKDCVQNCSNSFLFLPCHNAPSSTTGWFQHHEWNAVNHSLGGICETPGKDEKWKS